MVAGPCWVPSGGRGWSGGTPLPPSDRPAGERYGAERRIVSRLFARGSRATESGTHPPRYAFLTTSPRSGSRPERATSVGAASHGCIVTSRRSFEGHGQIRLSGSDLHVNVKVVVAFGS